MIIICKQALTGASQFFADVGYLPLLHTLVEERGPERGRKSRSVTVLARI
jgi:hypothetical protein